MGPLKNKILTYHGVIENGKFIIKKNHGAPLLHIDDVASAVEWYQEWRFKPVSTFLNRYPGCQSEWLQFYASRNHPDYGGAYEAYIFFKSFEDVIKNER